jgi:hypothetical protein
LARVRSLTHVTLASALLTTLFTVTAFSGSAFANSIGHCQETQLDVRWVGGGAGLGHIAEIIVITNISASACRVSGYPTVRMTGGANVVATVARRTRNGYLGGLGGPNATVPLPVVTLRAHGGTASSMVEGGDVPIGNAVECVLYTKVSITFAIMSPPYRFATRFFGCIRPQVHPIVKGSTGSSLK